MFRNAILTENRSLSSRGMGRTVRIMGVSGYVYTQKRCAVHGTTTVGLQKSGQPCYKQIPLRWYTARLRPGADTRTPRSSFCLFSPTRPFRVALIHKNNFSVFRSPRTFVTSAAAIITRHRVYHDQQWTPTTEGAARHTPVIRSKYGKIRAFRAHTSHTTLPGPPLVPSAAAHRDVFAPAPGTTEIIGFPGYVGDGDDDDDDKKRHVKQPEIDRKKTTIQIKRTRLVVITRAYYYYYIIIVIIVVIMIIIITASICRPFKQRLHFVGPAQQIRCYVFRKIIALHTRRPCVYTQNGRSTSV